jgi:hypothetical protein
MAKTKLRRTWPEPKKLAVLTEILNATSNGETIQSILKKHNISHGMYKRWNEELGGTLEEPATPPASQAPSTLPNPRTVSQQRPTTLRNAIDALRVKRDMLSEVIEDLERMENA